MPTLTLQLNDDIAEDLRRLASAQARSETDIASEALTAYVRSARPLPKGMGKYHSGHRQTSEQARDLLRQAAKDGVWP